jgi:predicted CXXCH cytochrome family protein
MMSISRSLRPALILMATLFFILVGAQAAVAAIDCFQCHDRAAFKKRVKHQPVSAGECNACHSPHVARHKGLLQQKVQDLCYSCHDDAASSHLQGGTHQPVSRGECLACHDPHSSDHKGLLTKKFSETCFSCHTQLPKKFKFTHTPYAKGQCDSCHQAHQSKHDNLLVKEPQALCLGCHPMQSVRQKHPNYPAELGNCGSCHSPHGSNRPALVRNVLHQPYAAGCKDCHTGKNTPITVDTCLACHPQVGEQMASSHNHLVRYGNNGCLACHSPHAGDDKRLLKGKERHVCGTCHEATFRRHDTSKAKHQMTGACSDCHAPHGSNHPVMAKAPINEVCANCHATHSQFSHPIGEKVFDPRTGQMMTCASCHASKGTAHPYHLKFSGLRDLCVQCHRDH